MAVTWRPIKSLPDRPRCPDMVLLWNGCNGPHLVWTMIEVPREIREGGTWSLWLPCPEPSEKQKRLAEPERYNETA